MTTDSFIISAIRKNYTMESAWYEYSTKKFGCSQKEFEDTWNFWISERIS